MSDIDEMFGSDSSGDEGQAPSGPADSAAEETANMFDDSDAEDGNDAVPNGPTAGDDADPFADSGSDLDPAPSAAPGGTAVAPTGETDVLDSEEEGKGTDSPAPQAGSPQQQQQDRSGDDDLFGSDSDSEADVGPQAGSGTAAEAAAEAEVDPFADSDDDGGDEGGSGGKTLGRLSKGDGREKGKGKKRSADVEAGEGDGATGQGPAKKAKSKKKTKKGDKGKKKRKSADGGGDGEGLSKKKKKKKKTKKTKGKGADRENAQQLEDLGLLSSGDDEEGSDADLEPEDDGVLNDKEGERGGGDNVRTRDDDDFIDNTDDNPDLLEEYNHDAPPAGSDSEAEEDKKPQYEDETPAQESAMTAVLKSMKKRKAQELSTSDREQIAQEFIFKLNRAADEDEEAVLAGKPALSKLKMLKSVKATLAKKDLQETFLEFDLLGFIKRWIQPYSNGQLPNLTIRKEMLAIVLHLPVQVDHLKRSGIGRVVMGLLNCKEETLENKRVLRELVTKWNRPVYGQDASYRAMRSMQDDAEAIEVQPSGSTSNGSRRRGGVSWSMPQREGPARKEAVGNILNAKARGVDPSKSRVPISNGYAFSKAPRSRMESHGRQPAQQVDTSARSKLLKKMANLSRPVNKGA